MLKAIRYDLERIPNLKGSRYDLERSPGLLIIYCMFIFILGGLKVVRRALNVICIKHIMIPKYSSIFMQ